MSQRLNANYSYFSVKPVMQFVCSSESVTANTQGLGHESQSLEVKLAKVLGW